MTYSRLMWDSQYDENFVASIEYVLFYRNQDIAPLESNGGEGYRVITSDLAADGKDHADVPSRQNFEALLSLLPQQVRMKRSSILRPAIRFGQTVSLPE